MITGAVDATTRRGLAIVLGSGQVIDRLDLMSGMMLPPPAETWDWAIARFGEIGRRRRPIHRVHAYPEWRTART